MRERHEDRRRGAGRVAGVIEQPTHTIPGDCMCTWTVTRPGAGTAAVSTLKYMSSLCANKHEQREKQHA